ncbi:hypothetical protein [Komagataeibacter kakiaceti]|uniref:hypothetical protein n=1 Tax=Komagataeibacter kakiaceti TaxID=943261 RepID=UPI00046F3CE8|nr:hypothetical protein [Komagataeibacter kakiaceti]
MIGKLKSMASGEKLSPIPSVLSEMLNKLEMAIAGRNRLESMKSSLASDLAKCRSELANLDEDLDAAEADVIIENTKDAIEKRDAIQSRRESIRYKINQIESAQRYFPTKLSAADEAIETASSETNLELNKYISTVRQALSKELEAACRPLVSVLNKIQALAMSGLDVGYVVEKALIPSLNHPLENMLGNGSFKSQDGSSVRFSDAWTACPEAMKTKAIVDPALQARNQILRHQRRIDALRMDELTKHNQSSKADEWANGNRYRASSDIDEPEPRAMIPKGIGRPLNSWSVSQPGEPTSPREVSAFQDNPSVEDAPSVTNPPLDLEAFRPIPTTWRLKHARLRQSPLSRMEGKILPSMT